MRTTFVKCLIERARVDERVFLITPDLGYSVLESFAEEFPDRFLNVGIAEQNAIGVAAGLALSGYIVYVYSIIPFVTMRCFEQVRVDVAYMETNVRIVGVGAGLAYGPAGATHHAIEDVAIMRALPNMTVCCPGDAIEAREIVNRSFEHIGPMYIRLGRGGEPIVNEDNLSLNIGEAVWLHNGEKWAIVATGNILDEAKKLYGKFCDAGENPYLISLPTLKPASEDVIGKLIDSGVELIITMEEHSVIGGLGSVVSDFVAARGVPVRVKKIGIPDCYSHKVGSQELLRKYYGLSDISVATAIA